MNGDEDTLPQRLEMIKQLESSILQQIRETQENLKKIQQKVIKYEHEMAIKDTNKSL